MPKLIFVRRDGQRFEVSAPIGQSLMEAATSNLIPGILGDCGGCVSCGTCEAVIDAPWSENLAPQQEDEIALLGDTLMRSPRIRLTCQINVNEHLDGVVIRVP